MARVVQRSFASGELAPEFWGQQDQDFYRSGAKTLRNVVVTKEGSLRKRSGLEYVAFLDGQQLVRFGASDGADFIVVFAASGIRIFRDGVEQAINPPAWAAGLYPPYSFVTHNGVTYTSNNHWTSTEPGAAGSAWAAETLPQFPAWTRVRRVWGQVSTTVTTGPAVVQLGDVLTLTLKGHEPFQVTRGTSGWSFGSAPFAAPLKGISTFSSGILVDYAGVASDDWHYARDWEWRVTAVYEEGGMWRETLDYKSVTATCAMTPDFRPATISVGNSGSAVRIYRIYRGYNGLFGLVGEVNGATSGSSLFIDRGENPDTTRQPPEHLGSSDLYETATNAPFDGKALKPNALAYWNQRAVLGGFSKGPATMLVGGLGALLDFTANPMLEPSDTDGAELALACREQEEIRAFMPADELLVFTSRGEWAVSAQGAVTPRTLSAKRLSARGLGRVRPLMVGGHVLFVSRAGAVYALALDGQSGKWVDRDLTALASHLFVGKQIVSWAYQQRPDGIVWCALDDGTLLSLTYRPEAGIMAWAQHDVGGDALSVEVADDGDFDAVYCLVTRDAGTFLERMRDVAAPDGVDDGFYLDCALAVDGRNRTASYIDLVPVLSFTADPGNTGEGGEFYRFYGPSKVTATVIVECTVGGVPGDGFCKVKVSANGGSTWGTPTLLPGGRSTLLALGSLVDTGVSLHAKTNYSMATGDRWSAALTTGQGFEGGNTVEARRTGVDNGLINTLGAVAGNVLRVESGTSLADLVVDPGLLDDAATASCVLSGTALPAALKTTISTWSILSKTFGGFLALAGTTVDVLADAEVLPDVVVDDAGYLTFTNPVLRAVAGLPYTSAIELLTPADNKGSPALELLGLTVRGSTAGAPALLADSDDTSGGQPESGSSDGVVSRRTVDGTVHHALEGEVAGAIVQTYPYPLRIFWVARDIEFQQTL